MRIERALKIRDTAKMRLRDLYSHAEFFGFKSDEINAGYSAILSDVGKAPQWVRSYLDGYRQSLTDRLYENTLIFGGFIDGEFYSTHSKRTDYYGKHGIDPSDWRNRASNIGHYFDRYKSLDDGTYDRGAFKPFYVSEV